MTREEHKAIINSIMENANNQGELSLLLTQLTEDYEQVLTENENNSSTLAGLTEDNEKLRKVNMQLFLKVGHEKPNTDNKKDDNIDTDNNETFENLFNEDGGLK